MSKLDEEKLGVQGQAAGVNVSGAQGAAGIGVPGQEPSQAAGQKSSGQYTNIQSYLDANKPQADTMGQNLASGIDTKAQDAQSKIQGIGAQAPQVQAYDPNAAYSKLGSLSDQDKQTYRTNKATGGYSGPQSVDQVQGYGDAQKAGHAAIQSVKNIGSEFGQQQELRNAYARPNYSAGENKLDQVLLQNSAGSKQALEGVAGKYAGLEGLLGSTNQNLGSSVNSANQQALANKQGIETGEKNQWDSLINPIQQRANQMNIDNPALYGRVSGDISDDVLSQESLDKLGLGAGQKLYDLKLDSYMNPNLSQVGLDNAANSQERGKYQALSDLIGDPSRNQITAGGKEINPVNFNKAGFDTAFAAKDKDYQAAYNNPGPDGTTPKQIQDQGLIADIERQFAAIANIQGGMMAQKRQELTTKYNMYKAQIDNLNNAYNPTRQISKG